MELAFGDVREEFRKEIAALRGEVKELRQALE